MECKLNRSNLSPVHSWGLFALRIERNWGKTKYQCAREYVLVPRQYYYIERVLFDIEEFITHCS